MRTRLSYQQRDERPASTLAAALRRVGADVVLGAWMTGPADAIVLLWSAAAVTEWSGAPDASALPSGLTDTDGAPLVPVRLDDTPLPPSLDGLRHVRLAAGADRMTDAAAAMIAHLGSTALPAPEVRGGAFEDAVVFSDFGSLGLFSACPRCGVSSERLRPYVTVDHATDRALRLVICGACGWQDACEL